MKLKKRLHFTHFYRERIYLGVHYQLMLYFLYYILPYKYKESSESYPKRLVIGPVVNNDIWIVNMISLEFKLIKLQIISK